MSASGSQGLPLTKRAALHAQIRRAIVTKLRFPPGIDLGRDATLDAAAEAALRVVERLVDVDWLEPCPDCEDGRVQCPCWHGCPSTVFCDRCNGTAKIKRETVDAQA